MSTKVRVAAISSDTDEWDDSLFEIMDNSTKSKKRANFNVEKKRKINHFIAERRLKQHILNDYSYTIST